MFLEGLGISSAISVELSIVPMAKAGPTRPRMKLTPVGQLVMLVYSLHEGVGGVGSGKSCDAYDDDEPYADIDEE